MVSFATAVRALVLWCAILVLAVVNGALREQALTPAFGGAAALAISGVTLSICVFTVALLGAPWYRALARRQWLLVGLLWAALTLLFEFAFGRLVRHESWAELLQAWTFGGGNLWPAVVAVTALSPWLAARLRGLA